VLSSNISIEDWGSDKLCYTMNHIIYEMNRDNQTMKFNHSNLSTMMSAFGH